MPLERRASSWLNHRFGSEGSTESSCSGCGASDQPRCGVPRFFALSSVSRFSTRVVWLTSSRRSSDASRVGRVDDLRDGAVAGDVGRRAAHRAADREAADAERRAAAGRARLRLRALRLVHLAAALADELAVGLAFEELGADDARLEHAPVERLGCVEVRPDRAEVAGRVPRAEVELQVEARHALAEERRGDGIARSGNDAGDIDAANLR